MVFCQWLKRVGLKVPKESVLWANSSAMTNSWLNASWPEFTSPWQVRQKVALVTGWNKSTCPKLPPYFWRHRSVEWGQCLSPVRLSQTTLPKYKFTSKASVVWKVCQPTFTIRGERYYRSGIVSRILALFGKYRISRYQGNLARFYTIFLV